MTDVRQADEFTANIHGRISDIPKADWEAYLKDRPHPLMSWEFLNALEESGCVTEETGWAPRHIWLKDNQGRTHGCAPLYAKTHSRGEYVFDHAWADALYRAGGTYYPKLQSCIPFTPVEGPRLLAQTHAAQNALIKAMLSVAHQHNYSSLHLTFLNTRERSTLEQAGLLIRQDRQFHFINRDYQNFDGFLASLTSRKRKNIRKERKAAQDGIMIKRLIGDDIKPEHWDIFYQCYLDTSARKWGQPYLNREFFTRIHETIRDNILLIIAYADATPIAAALNFIGHKTLYGRNWGALAHKPFLHFELCYYQAIEAALYMGFDKVEAGAQGEHKLARGYEPVPTYSAHFIAHGGLRAAVEDYVTRERHAVDYEINRLGEHTPFKKVD